MKLFKSPLITIIVLILLVGISNAGPYTDDLSKCLIESTSPQDRIELVQWMFSAASQHPAVKNMCSVSEEQSDEMNKKTAALFMKLLTESCREQTQNALKYEGETTLSQSFNVLGQVAGKELFASPEVSNNLAGFKNYLDMEKLKQIVPKRD